MRNVTTTEKKQVFAEYGIPYSRRSNYEVDHLISLELGGSNDISNLWPEAYGINNGSRVKDVFENKLHKQVCTGKMTIDEAQKEISTDWLTHYKSPQTKPTKAATNSELAAPVFVPQITTAPVVVNEAPAPTILPITPPTQEAPAYYTSSYGSAKLYYPASCSAWRSLSPKYLKSFGSLTDLLQAYPNRSLSPQCH